MTSVLKKIDGGIVLISIGIVLLCNATGYVGWGVWLLYLNFWPVLLIMAGIKIILSINKNFEFVGIILGTILWLVLIFGGLIYFKINGDPNYANGATKAYTHTIQTDNTDNAVHSYDLKFSFGEYEVNTASDNNNYILYVSGLHSIGLEDPTISVNQGGNNSKTISFTQNQNSIFFIPFTNTINTYELSIGNTNIDQFEVDLGAGKYSGNFDHISIDETNIDIGAGEALMVLGSESRLTNLNVNIGAGQMTLTLPENYGYIISYSVGAGSMNIEGNEVGGLGSNETNRNSSNILTADNVLKITVSVGAGEFEINYVSE